MKRILGLSILVLGLSIPAHAQHAGGTANSGGILSNSGGGYIGAGGMGKVSFPNPPYIPETHFSATTVSGTDAEFVPSTFLPFDNAVAAGRAVLDAQHASLAQAAEANSAAPREKARLALVEDAVGDPVIATIVYE